MTTYLFYMDWLSYNVVGANLETAKLIHGTIINAAKKSSRKKRFALLRAHGLMDGKVI